MPGESLIEYRATFRSNELIDSVYAPVLFVAVFTATSADNARQLAEQLARSLRGEYDLLEIQEMPALSAARLISR